MTKELLEQFYNKAMEYISQDACQQLCSHQFDNQLCQECKRNLSDEEKIGGLLYKYFGTKEEFESYYKDDKLKKILSNVKFEERDKDKDEDINKYILKLALSEKNDYNQEKRNGLAHISHIINIHNFEDCQNRIHNIVETNLRNGTIYQRFCKNKDDELSQRQILESVLRIAKTLDNTPQQQMEGPTLDEQQEQQQMKNKYYDFCCHNLLIGNMPIEKDGIKIFFFQFTFIKICKCKLNNVQQALKMLIHFLYHGTVEYKDILILGNSEIQKMIEAKQDSIYFPELIFKKQQDINETFIINRQQDNIYNTLQNLKTAEIDEFSIEDLTKYGPITKFKLKIAFYKLKFIQKCIQLLYQYNLPHEQHNQSLFILLTEYLNQLQKFKEIIKETENQKKIQKKIDTIQEIKKKKENYKQDKDILNLLEPYVSVNSKFFFRLQWIKEFDNKFEIPQIYITFKPYIIKKKKLSFKKFEQYLNEPLSSNIDILDLFFQD